MVLVGSCPEFSTSLKEFFWAAAQGNVRPCVTTTTGLSLGHGHDGPKVCQIAAQAMRRIIVDHARRHNAVKRGGDNIKVELEEAQSRPGPLDVDVLELDDALTALAAFDPQQSRIVELRFFGGLSIEETAEVIGISPATVKRDWSMAKAWLHREMETDS